MQNQNVTVDTEHTKFPVSGYFRQSEIRHSVRCLCPKCGLGHILRLSWPCGTSTSIPGIYCRDCQEAVGGVESNFDPEVFSDIFREFSK